ncbi:hypothetical protein ACQKWADRAFT_331151 [Trichoderma austrokoningii]
MDLARAYDPFSRHLTNKQHKSFFFVITIADTSRGIKAAAPAKIFLQAAAVTSHDRHPNMSDYPISFHSRITRASYLARRNDTSDAQTSSGSSHDYIPIIVMSVIVLVIVMALILLAQYTKVLERKRSNDGGDDPENAKNASKIERLDQMVPSKTYKSWKEGTENAKNPLIREGNFISCVICLETLQDDDTIRPLPCSHVFHSLCLAKWYLRRHDTCPICKAHFMTLSEKPSRVLQRPDRTHAR